MVDPRSDNIGPCAGVSEVKTHQHFYKYSNILTAYFHFGIKLETGYFYPFFRTVCCLFFMVMCLLILCWLINYTFLFMICTQYGPHTPLGVNPIPPMHVNPPNCPQSHTQHAG